MHHRQTTAGRSKMHRRSHPMPRPCCNALTVSQRRAISRLIARRKRSTVSNVPCPVEFNRPLCCLCGTNFVTGRLIIKPGRCSKHWRRFSHYCSIFIINNVPLCWNLTNDFVRSIITFLIRNKSNVHSILKVDYFTILIFLVENVNILWPYFFNFQVKYLDKS